MTVRDGESRTATSTFTQHLSSATSMLLHATETVRTVKDGELLSSVKKEPMLRLMYASNTLCGNVSDVLMTLLFFLYHDSVETSAGRGLYRNTCDLSVKPLNHNSIPCSSHPTPPPHLSDGQGGRSVSMDTGSQTGAQRAGQTSWKEEECLTVVADFTQRSFEFYLSVPISLPPYYLLSFDVVSVGRIWPTFGVE